MRNWLWRWPRRPATLEETIELRATLGGRAALGAIRLLSAVLHFEVLTKVHPQGPTRGYGAMDVPSPGAHAGLRGYGRAELRIGTRIPTLHFVAEAELLSLSFGCL